MTGIQDIRHDRNTGRIIKIRFKERTKQHKRVLDIFPRKKEKLPQRQVYLELKNGEL